MFCCVVLRCVGYKYGGPAIEVVEEEEMRKELAALKKGKGIARPGV